MNSTTLQEAINFVKKRIKEECDKLITVPELDLKSDEFLFFNLEGFKNYLTLIEKFVNTYEKMPTLYADLSIDKNDPRPLREQLTTLIPPRIAGLYLSYYEYLENQCQGFLQDKLSFFVNDHGLRFQQIQNATETFWEAHNKKYEPRVDWCKEIEESPSWVLELDDWREENNELTQLIPQTMLDDNYPATLHKLEFFMGRVLTKKEYTEYFNGFVKNIYTNNSSAFYSQKNDNPASGDKTLPDKYIFEDGVMRINKEWKAASNRM